MHQISTRVRGADEGARAGAAPAALAVLDYGPLPPVRAADPEAPVGDGPLTAEQLTALKRVLDGRRCGTTAALSRAPGAGTSSGRGRKAPVFATEAEARAYRMGRDAGYGLRSRAERRAREAAA